MMASLECLNELDVLSRNKSRETQQNFLKRIVDLFFITQNLQSKDENALFGRVMIQIIGHVDRPSRVALAQRLAKAPKAPSQIINHLATDHIEVAEPILRHSVVLSDYVLLNIIDNHIIEHSNVICQRHAVSEAITDALLDECFETAVLCMLKNSKARFSLSGFDKLIEMASKDKKLRTALLTREDKPEDCLDRIKETMSYVLTKEIMQKHSDISEHKADELAFARVDKILKADEVHCLKKKKNLQPDQLESLYALNNLTQYIITDLARNGQEKQAIAALALLSKLDEKVVSHIVIAAEISALGIFSRSLHFSRDSYLALLELKARNRKLSKDLITISLKRYDEITFEHATTVMIYLTERFKNIT